MRTDRVVDHEWLCHLDGYYASHEEPETFRDNPYMEKSYSLAAEWFIGFYSGHAAQRNVIQLKFRRLHGNTPIHIPR